MKKIILLVFLFLSTIPALSQGEPMKVSEPKAAQKFEEGKKYIAIIKTTKGVIVCELNPQKAPLGVTNFIQLANAKFYDGLTFHRVVPNFVIQGGDPKGTGSGGPGYTIPAEIGLPHVQGALAWARLGDEVNPERRSSGSQFYITLEPTPFLDGGYSVFGLVTSGMDVVKKIAQGDKMESVTIEAK
ncbi:peptidylprolyl isomerase [bacterium]|nr:peptidylprolyl isomerase [bacterium]